MLIGEASESIAEKEVTLARAIVPETGPFLVPRRCPLSVGPCTMGVRYTFVNGHFRPLAFPIASELGPWGDRRLQTFPTALLGRMNHGFSPLWPCVSPGTTRDRLGYPESKSSVCVTTLSKPTGFRVRRVCTERTTAGGQRLGFHYHRMKPTVIYPCNNRHPSQSTSVPSSRDLSP